jgi:hypothetical protein
LIAKQAVAYADALIEALAATALKQHQMRARVSDPGASTWANKKPRRCDPTRLFFGDWVSALSGDMSAFSDDSYLPETSCYDEISIHRGGTELRHAKFKRSIQNSATA